MFAVAPAAAAVAGTVALTSAALVTKILFGLEGWSVFAGMWLAARFSDVELALVKTCVDAILLGPLAIFGLPVLTKHVAKFGVTLVLVWITVLASLTGIDTVVFQPLKIDDLPTAVPKP
jgi:hypothetical protein